MSILLCLGVDYVKRPFLHSLYGFGQVTIVTQESGISVDNQDSVMQIAPAEFSSASCWISSTKLGSDLTLVDSIVGIPYTLCCHSLLTLLKPLKLTDLCVNRRFSAMWLPQC